MSYLYLQMPRRRALRFLVVIAFLLEYVPRTGAAAICTINILGDPDTRLLPDQPKSGANCSCWQEFPLAGDNVVAYPAGNAALFTLCDPSGFSGGFYAFASGPVAVNPSWDAAVSDGISLKFTGSDGFVLDGASASASAATAADLDLTSGMPLFHFYNINGLTLRNLVFRNLTTSSPLILLEDCTSVVLENVLFEDVRIAASSSGSGGLVSAVFNAAVLANVSISGVLARRVAVDVVLEGDGAAAATGALVSWSQCSSGCSISELSFEDVTLAEGWAALRVAASPGLQLEGVAVAGASCSGATGAVVQVTDGGSMAATSVVLSGLRLQGGCPGLALRGESGGMVVTNITLQDSVFEGDGAAVWLSQMVSSSAQDAPVVASLRGLTLSGVTLSGGGGAVLVDSSEGLDVQGIVLRGVGPGAGSNEATTLVCVSASQAVEVEGVEVWPIDDGQQASATWVQVQGGAQVAVSGVRNAGGPSGMVAGAVAIDISDCLPGCSIRNVSLVGVSLGDSSRALSVVRSTSVQITDVQLVDVRGSCAPDSFDAAVRLVHVSLARLERITVADFVSSGPLQGVLLIESNNVAATDIIVRGFVAASADISTGLCVVDSGELIVEGMACSNSRSGSGPCIIADGSSVTVSNSSFTSNGAGGSSIGGAIYLQGSASKRRTSMRILGTVFDRNAAGIGGAIAMKTLEGGKAPSLLLEACQFRDNTATLRSPTEPALGGDVYSVDGSSLTITSSSFAGSSATGTGSNGGSIFAQKASTKITLSNFTRCSSTNRGGAVYHEPMAQSCPTPDSCGLSLVGCRFEENDSEEGGAVLMLLNSNMVATFTISSCVFAYNTAGTSGGALCMPGNCLPYEDRACAQQADVAKQGIMQLYDSQFLNNSSPKGGAILHAYNNAQGINITSSQFVANNASEAAGLYLRAVPLVEIRHCRFEDNTATLIGAVALTSLHSHGLIHNTTFRNNICNRNAADTGSALYVSEYDGVTQDGTASGPLFSFSLTNSTFEDNFSSSDAGGATITRCEALLEDVMFHRNSAARRGGALFMEQDVGGQLVAVMEGIPRRVTNGTLRRVHFYDNRATTNGGALLLSGWHLQLEDIFFVNNSANTFRAGGSDNAGGAVFATSCPSVVRINNVLFSDNKAYQGGAMYAELCSISIKNATFKDNTALGDAGAVLVNGFTSNDFTTDSGVYAFDSLDTTFERNTARRLGGALKVYWARVNLTHTDFIDNSAYTEGGAVYLQIVPPMPSSATGAPLDTGMRGLFDRCEFRRNAVNNSGGALYHSASAVHLTDCELQDNTAGNGFFSDSWSNAGGAIFATSCTAPMVLSRTKLGRNKADGRGGAVALLSCAATLEESYLYGNVAKLLGGAVAAGHQVTSAQPEGPQLSLVNCNLTSNSAVDEHGGAVYATSVSLTVRGSRLVENAAKQMGGAVNSIGAPVLMLSNNSIEGNNAGVSGGAVWAESFALAQVDTTHVVNNTATSLGGGVVLFNPRCAHLEGLLLADNSAAKGGGVYVAMPVFTQRPAAADLGCAAAFNGRLGEAWKTRLSNASQRVLESQGNAVVLVAANMTATNNRALSGQGGVLLLDATRGSSLLDGMSASGNSAGEAGGAVAVSDTRLGDAMLYISSSLLYGNTAAGEGGALALDGSRTQQRAVVLNTTMQFNRAASGGAVSLRRNASLELDGCTLEGNTATGQAGGSGGGGSVYAASCNWLMINGTTISSSSASNGHGGGVFSDGCGAVLLSGVTLHFNSATGSGGAAYLVSSTASDSALVLVSGGNMSYNHAGSNTGDGDSGNKVQLDRMLPVGSGGALYLGGSLAVLVDRSHFEGNVAEVMGGAVGIGLQCPEGETSSTSPTPPILGVTPGEMTSATGGASLAAPGLLELPGAMSLTLQALGRAANRSSASKCWPAVANQPTLWNNTAGISGGALYSGSPYTLTLLCGDAGGRTPGNPADIDHELGALVDEATQYMDARTGDMTEGAPGTAGAEGGGSGSAPIHMGMLPTTDHTRALCFVPQQRDDGSVVPLNHAHRGYGDELATMPKHLVLTALTEYDKLPLMSDGNNTANLVNTTDSSSRLLVYGRLLLQSATDSAGGLAGASIASSAVASGDGSAGEARGPLWLRRAALQSDGVPANECWPGQVCDMVLPTNAAVTINVAVYDALNQLANDTSAARPVVQAFVEHNGPGSQADLLGNPTALVVGGVASVSGVRLRARKGNYALRLELDTTDIQVDPLRLNVTVPPCSLGEISLDGGFLCARCSANTYNLDVDSYDSGVDDVAAVTSQGGGSIPGHCFGCPEHADCTGGAVLVPQQGFWHSAANSTKMHQCPNAAACRDGDDVANAALVRCQERWYAYFGSPRRFRSLLEDDQGGATVVGAYLDVYRVAAADPRVAPTTPLLTDGMFDGFLLDCALWGLPNSDSLSYMQLQCAKGYSGMLCATCTSYDGAAYALDSDFNCNQCFSKWATVLIGVAMFIANTLWLGFSVLMTFLTDYSYVDAEEGVPAADLLKVLIVHFQFFLIVTRINMDWPSSVVGLQSALGSITGSVKQVYSPSCLWPGADSATHATVQVLSGLLLPIFSVLLVMALWTLRYYVWNQGRLWTSRVSSRLSTSKRHMPRNASMARDGTMSSRGAPLHRQIESLKSFRAGDDDDNDNYDYDGNDLVTPEDIGLVLVPGAQAATALRGVETTASELTNGDVLGGGTDTLGAAATRVLQGVVVAARAAGRDADGSGLGSMVESASLVAASSDHGSCTSGSITAVGVAAAGSLPAAAGGVTSRFALGSNTGPDAQGYISAKAAVAESMMGTGANDGRDNNQSPSRDRGAGQRPHHSIGLLRTVLGVDRSAHSASQVTAADATKASSGTAMALNNRRSMSESRPHMKFLSNEAIRAQEQQQQQQQQHMGCHPPGGLSAMNSMARSEAANSVAPSRNTTFRFFTKREALSYVDANMSLPSQLFLVLVVTSFVLMPIWATEALSIFSCYQLDHGVGDYGENQRARARYGYWVRDMNQECYSGRHLTMWVPIGVVSVVVLCLAMPVLCAGLMVARRKRLREVEVLQVYGFLYCSYKEKYYFWESISQAQTLLLVVVEVFGRALMVFFQALLLEVILLTILMVNTFYSPIVHEQLTSLQLLSLGIICMTVALGMFTSNPVTTISEASINLLGALILIINCFIILAFLAVIAYHAAPAIKREAAKWMVKLGCDPTKLKPTISRTWTRLTPARWRRAPSTDETRKVDENIDRGVDLVDCETGPGGARRDAE